MAILPLAAGLGSGNLTDPADLHPVYRNSMLICAALMLLGAVVAVIFVPTRLPAHPPASSFCDPAGPPVHPRPAGSAAR